MIYSIERYNKLISSKPEEYYWQECEPRYEFFRCAEKNKDNWFPCRSPYCRDHIRRWCAAAKAAANRPSKNDKIVTYSATLPFGYYIPPYNLNKARNWFTKQMRKDKKFEYFWRVHYENNIYNLHLLIKTDKYICKADMENKWRWGLWKSIERYTLRSSVYLELTKSVEKYSNYLTYGNDADLQSKLPPRGAYRNLYGTTRGYDTL